jgi:hypothetical protein
MGRAKNEQMEAEDNWGRKAMNEGIHCAACGSRISYDDRDVYFDSGMCGSCEHTWNKDD